MRHLILIISLLFIGCGLPEHDYAVSYEDLHGKRFYSMNEFAHRDSSMLTTTITFYDDNTLLVEEKLWRVDGGVVSWATDAYGNPIIQQHTGEMMRAYNNEYFQVVEFNIRRINGNGAEVMGGYKDYILTKGTYQGTGVIVLTEAARQQSYTSSGYDIYEWVPLRNGDITYLLEY